VGLPDAGGKNKNGLGGVCAVPCLPVRGYGQYCPVTRAAEVFAERWTPVIVRNMLLGCQSFAQIADGAPGMSRTLLTQRLRHLERCGIVERRPSPRGRGSVYLLTDAGRELEEVCMALGTWGARWAELGPEHLDAYTVLWATCRRMTTEGGLPERRVVVRFELRDGPKRRFWLILQRPEAEVCLKPPGFEEDLVVTTDVETLTKWHMGWTSLDDARRAGRFVLEGPRELVRAFPSWNWLSRFAEVRPARAS